MRTKVLAAVLGLVLLAAGCGDDDGGGSEESSAVPSDELTVNVLEETYVDESRETPRSGNVPAEPTRTLESLVVVPEGDGPYPLLVFSHGLGAVPDYYLDLIEPVAAAGFVVVAPRFPLTNMDAPNGPDAGDTQNQPGDVSFLIDTVLAAAEAGEEPFAVVDPDRIGAFGHSNGAITTYGATMHTCCRDDRIDAAVIVSGTRAPFNDGEYDVAEAPPTLLVHGTEDELVNHEESVLTFNELDGVKGLLSMPGVDHSEFLTSGGQGYDATVATIRDFFLSQLRDDESATERLAREEAAGGMELHFATEGGTDVTLPTLPPNDDRQASVEPTEGLTDGQLVTVSWEGFTAGQAVNVVQCSQGGTGGNDVCDLTNGQILQPNPTGSGSLELEIIVGPVGSGTCDATTDDCVIVVNDGGSTEPDATIRIPISFAAS